MFKECKQIFFGGVFEKSVRMLFAARRNEEGNVHRREGVSKTVIKNMCVGFFKNSNQKDRPKEAPFGGTCLPTRQENITADSAERSFPPLMLKGMSCFLSVFFPRCAPLTLKSAFQTSRMKKISGFQPDSQTYQPDVLMNRPSLMKGKQPYTDNKPESLPCRPGRA
jgi:hypothetical protein